MCARARQGFDFLLHFRCRYLYFLQLKNSVLNGNLQCGNEIAIKLASYALQGTSMMQVVFSISF